jgi:toxin ParE1/3/4
MSELRYTGLAERDIRDILQHIARDNPRAAVNFAGRIEKACQRLARFPRLGTRVDHLGSGIRVFSVGNYLIYYREESGDELRTIRVVHGARDERRYSLEESRSILCSAHSD